MFTNPFPLVLAFAWVPVLTFASELRNLRTQWAVQTEGPVRGAAVIAGDLVYFGSADGNLYAVAKAGGELRWKVPTGGGIAGTPAAAGSTVIVAGRGPEVLALDAATGAKRWSFRFAPDLPVETEWDYFTASPVIDGDQVLVASGDGHLYALELASGKLRWKFQTGDRIRATPLVLDGMVYQPGGDDFVHVLSARDGSLQWKFETEGTKLDRSQGFIRSDIFTRPSVRQGLLVVGSRDGNVYAVDATTHEKRWAFRYGSTWAMSTIADDSTVYVGWSTNNMVCALDLLTGAKRWEFKAGAHTYTTALLDGDEVVWGCADGNVRGFDRHTGALHWTYAVGSEVYSSLVRDGDTLYFGADDGRLRAVVTGPPARRAVYLPAAVPDNISGFIVDAGLAPHLVARGFERLDSGAALAEFVRTPTADDRPGVVVFAFAQIPPDVVGDDPATGPLRAYLDSGGKVVWPWGRPNLHLFDEQGNYVRRDATVGPRLLGVPFLEFEDSGNYFSTATPAGRNWGLPAWGKTSFASLPPDAEVTALAHDEYGRISAWVKSFHPRPGTGWVAVCPSGFGVAMTPRELELLEAIATYGVQ